MPTGINRDKSSTSRYAATFLIPLIAGVLISTAFYTVMMINGSSTETSTIYGAILLFIIMALIHVLEALWLYCSKYRNEEVATSRSQWARMIETTLRFKPEIIDINTVKITSSMANISVTLAVILLCLASVWVFLYNATVVSSSSSLDEEIIGQLIQNATDSELYWYKHPAENRSQELGQFFLPSEVGGERLPRIERTVRRLNEESRRFADDAVKIVVVQSIEIAPDGASATLLTRERWYQPLLQLEDGQERRITAPLGHPTSTYDQVIYELVKIDGNWKISNSPIAR